MSNKTKVLTPYVARDSESIYKSLLNHRLLTSEEERKLGKKSLAGDLHARDELIRHNLKLVWKRARKYHWSSVPFGDLLQEGNLGLLRAAEKFDPSFGVRFSTYATPWIKQGVLEALFHSSLVSIPRGIYQDIQKIYNTEIRLMREVGGKVSDAQIAEAILLPEKRVRELRKGVLVSSMDSNFSDETENTLYDIIPDETAHTNLVDPIEHTGRITKLLLLIDTAKIPDKKKPRVREVLVRAFGLPDCGVADCYGQTITEIAEVMGISPTSVSDLLKLGKRILKKRGESLR